MSSEQSRTKRESIQLWGSLTLLFVGAGVVWLGYLKSSAGENANLSPAAAIAVGNCIIAGFTGSLLGFFAARKNRNPLGWAFGFGLPALLAGLFPLLIGGVAMAFTPHAEARENEPA